MTARTTRNWGLIATLLSTGFLPHCSCDEGPGIETIPVEMRLSLVESDPCSGAAVPRRIPDDYEASGIQMLTDFGSRAERYFEVRSVGTAPLSVQSVSLSSEDEEFVLELLDAEGNAVTLPREIPADSDLQSPAGLVIKVSFQATDGESDLVNLIVMSDDPKRSEITFGLSAGNGRLEICGTNGCVSDPEITFGDVSRGESATEQLTLKNVGEGDLDLRSIKLESSTFEFCAPEATEAPERPANAPACDLMNLCKVLKPGEEYVVNVRYNPVDGGQDTGVIRVTSGDATLGTVDVPINGVGAGPGVCVCVVDGTDCQSVSVLDFGFGEVNQTTEHTVRLQSCGTEPVTITEAMLETMQQPYVTGPEFSITTAFQTGVFQPGEYSEGAIGFTPAAPGEARGGLRFAYDPGGIKNWLLLIGRASVCDLEAIPDTVAFGVIGSGATATRNVLLVNNGARDCTVTAISDPANGFSIPQKPALPLVITPGDSFQLGVQYESPSRQTPVTDTSTFDVTSDEPAPGDVNTVTLVADGGGAAICDVTVNPSGFSASRDGTLQFGAVNIGYSRTMSIRVTNTGNSQCQLTSFQMHVQEASQFSVAGPPLPASFGPGQAVSIDVTFAPTQGVSGILPFYNSLLNYVDFSLSGQGLPQPDWSIGIIARPTVPTIDIIPEAVDFGLVTWERPQAPDNRSSCGSEEREVRIYNSGTGPLEITKIEIDPTSDPVFLVSQVRDANNANINAPYAMTIPAGQFAQVALRFYPTRINPAQHQGLLNIENNVTTLSTVPLVGEGTANTNQTDTFTQLTDNKIDILWVIDDSGSMGEEQNLLSNNFGSFISFADTLGVDYQIGVITTEVNDATSGKLWACNGFSKIIQSSDPNRVAAFQCASRVTNPPNGNSRPNPGGSDEQEAGLQAAKIALEPPVRDAENAGFLRADARLAVIAVSDEEDQSQGPVGLYVDFFRNIKGFRNPQLTTVSAIAGDVPNGCATAAAGTRYNDAASQLGGQFESICASSWQNMLQNIGLGVFALRTAWTLSRLADQNSITVTVNGTAVPQNGANGWTYDPQTNSVELHGTSVPAPGATVEVRYGAVCLP